MRQITCDETLAIIDLHMPDLNGVDAMHQARVMQAGASNRTQFVVLSADVTPEAIRSCQSAGAACFLPKPVVASRLLDIIADLAEGGGVTPDAALDHAEAVQEETLVDQSLLVELKDLDRGDGFLRKYVGACRRDITQNIEAMNETCVKRNWQLLREHAHALKGVAGNLGLVQLAVFAGQMMRMSDAELAQASADRLLLLKECCDRSWQALFDTPGLADADDHMRQPDTAGTQPRVPES